MSIHGSCARCGTVCWTAVDVCSGCAGREPVSFARAREPRGASVALVVTLLALVLGALWLAGCPAQSLEVERMAECCEPVDAGDGCEWSVQIYRAHRYAGPLASDADACRNVGLEPAGER